MKRLARFFSAIFTPLLMPTYGVFLAMWTSVLYYLPLGTRLSALGVIFALTCVVPLLFIFLLHSLKVIKDVGLNNQRERWLPYLFMMLCYAASAIYLISHHAPLWLSSFVWGALAAVVISFFINFAWKISGHMAGIGGVVAILVILQCRGLAIFDISWLICLSILISGVVGTSRILLDRHTLGQVIAGFINGFCCVWIANAILN